MCGCRAYRIKLVLPLSTTATTKFFFPFLRAANGFVVGGLRVIWGEGSLIDADSGGGGLDEKNDAKYARIPVPAPESVAIGSGVGTSSS